MTATPEQIREHLKTVAREWCQRPSGYVIHQRHDKFMGLLRLKYKTQAIDTLADDQLKAFQIDLDKLMHGDGNDQ